MRLSFIYHCGAGDGGHDPAELCRRLESCGYQVRAQDREDAAYPSLLRQPADLLAVAGGDGTVADVIRRMPDVSVPIGILPLGTANNIARSFGIAGEIEDVAACWREVQAQPLDIFEAVGPWGTHLLIESLGIGAFAAAQRKARADKLPDAHEIAAAREKLRQGLVTAKAKPVRISANGRDLSGDYLCVECLNIARMGPGLPMSPRADSGDGQLEIMTIAESNRATMLDWLAAPDDAPCPVPSTKDSAVEIAWNHDVLRLDDEFPDRPSESVAVRLRYSGKSARILAP